MPKNSISRKVISMSELNNKKVVQHNDLIMSVAKMDAVPLKFFELAVACLDTEDVPADRTVYVSKELLFSFFKAKSQNKHSKFKEALLQVHQQAVFLMNELDEETGKYEYRIISPLERTAWNDYGDDVSFKFTESIMPFLIELKSNFTQYLLSDIGKLNSKHAITIYKWLSMNYNQYEYYKANGNRTEKQLESLINPIISIRDLRKITDTEKSYAEMTDFTKRILDNSTSMITENTTLNVEYKKIKKGNRVADIQFFITKKQVAQNEFYKEEQQDPDYLQSKEEQALEQQRLYFEGMQNTYTTFLMESTLISFEDMRDADLIVNLQKRVYPLYDELKQLRGIAAVKKHTNYVASNRQAYSKKNIAKYLYESVSKYLVNIKKQNTNNQEAEIRTEQPKNDDPKQSNNVSENSKYLYNWLDKDD